MKTALKYLLPLVALIVAVMVSYTLFLTTPKVEQQTPEIKVPLVTVAQVSPETTHIPVHTRGTVTPGTEIQLVSEVSGQVLELSKNFANGGFFRKGEVLVKVDPIEYEVQIKRAEASKAQAYQAMLQADAERKARSRVKNANKSALASYDIQYRQAKAQYDATVAELESVELQKERTIIRAPFDGRVRLAALNMGQFLRPGQQMGTIYAVDVAEIRLPLSDRQLSLVNVPMQFQENPEAFPEVLIKEEFAGKEYTWKGELVRSEGGLDERNRLLYVVAQVQDPYAPDPLQPGRPELMAGSFVEAVIAGRKFERVFTVPRKALRNGAELWVVDDSNRLQQKEVDIIYKSKDSIYVRSGLKPGDKVVLSQMDIAVAGMKVRTEVIDPYDTSETSAETNANLFDSKQPTKTESKVSTQANPERKPSEAIVPKPQPEENKLTEDQTTVKSRAVDSLRHELLEPEGEQIEPVVEPVIPEPAPAKSKPGSNNSISTVAAPEPLKEAVE